MHKSMSQVTDALQKGLDAANRSGASAAKLIFGRSESVSCSFENGRLKTTSTHRGSSYNITTIVNGRRGSASGNDMGSLDEMVERAVSLAEVGSAAHFEKYPEPAKTRKVETYSKRTEALTRDQMIESCQAMADGLKKYDSELYIEAGAGRSMSEKLILTSGGVCHRSTTTGWGLGSGVQRTEGSDMLFANCHRGWRDVNEFYDPDFVLRHVLDDLRNGQTIVESPKGKAPVFLNGHALNMFLFPFMLGVNGRNVVKGDSPLKGRLKEQVLDPSITIIDDPHLDYCPGAAEIDDDGVPTRVIDIVKNGVLESFLYDLDSAGLAGAEPTGNNGCSPYSLKVLPGEETGKELLSSVDDGIYIKSLLGFGQGNIMNGDFSSNVALGFRIKKGKIVGRVKNTMVAGNIYELLKSNVQLSSDYEDPTERMPYARLSGISVSAR